MGTSLGISGAYLAFTNPSSEIISIEGCPETAAIASKNFKALEIKNIELLNMEFDPGLEAVFKKWKSFDLVYVDGNHKKIPTLAYFDYLISKAHQGSVLIFDDIHWSKGMEEAWQQMMADERSGITLDLYQFGIVFPKKDQIQKQQHVIVPVKWKPWTRLIP